MDALRARGERHSRHARQRLTVGVDRMFRGIRPGVARLFRLAARTPDAVAHDVDEEIRHHLEARTAQLIARGATPAQAEAEAARRFGDLDAAQRTLQSSASRRDGRLALRELLKGVRDDLRFALRSLRRSPAFVFVAISSLAIGIGVNTAMFSVVDGVLFKPLPYPAADELVRVWTDHTAPPGAVALVRDGARSFRQLAAYDGGTRVTLAGESDPRRVVAMRTSGNLFSTLRVPAWRGRTFSDRDADAASPPVALLSHALWRERYGEDAAVLGRMVRIDGTAYEVVGIMPPGFRLPDVQADVWLPVRAERGGVAWWWVFTLRMVARIEPGVSTSAAAAETALLLDRAREAFPMRMPDAWGANPEVAPLQEAVVGGSRPVLLLMLGAVALVLLVACVNVATLYLGRTGARARELAVRSALGAGRQRIMRLLLLECAVVAAVGSAVGLALAALSIRVLVSIIPAGTPRVQDIVLDGRVVGFSVLLMLLSVLLFGLLPTLRAANPDLSQALKGGGRSGKPARFRIAAALVVAQLAMAVVLVVGAGLLTRSVWQLQQVPLGFRTDQVLTATLPLPAFPADTATRARLFYASILERLRATPGVQDAALASAAPFGDGVYPAAMAVEAHPTPAGDVPPTPEVVSVSDGYFTTLDVPLLRGRLFGATDRADTDRVGIVDEVAARQLWPGEDPIGKRIKYVSASDWITVVGVVASVKRHDLRAEPTPTLHVPITQETRDLRVLVRTSADGVLGANTIRAAVAAVDASAPIGAVQPLDALVRGSTADARFAALLLAVFAGVGLLLAAVGVYGVMAASVLTRTREIGVRMALGADSGRVLRLVLRQGMGLAVTGVLIGLAVAAAGARLLERFLYGVRALDTLVLLSVPLLLLAVAFIATLVPALRAAAVPPLTAIKEG